MAMTDTPILPAITFRQGRYWFRFKTVTEAVGGLTRLLQAVDDESPEGQRLLSCLGMLRKYGDAPARSLPDDELSRLVEALQCVGTVHTKRMDSGE